MPLRPLAIGFALVCLALALLLAAVIVRGLRRRRWFVLIAVAPALCLIVLASLPVPYIFGIGAPHAVFNRPAPVPTTANAYYLSNLSPISWQPQQPLLIATQASTGKILWQHTPSGTHGDMYITEDADAVYAAVYSTSSATVSTEVFALDGATGAIRWQRSLPDTAVYSAPLLEGGALVLSSFSSDSPTSISQQFLALRPADGQQLWSVHVSPAANTFRLASSPDPSIFYVLPNSSALEARSISDGRLLWANTQVSGRVVFGPDAIYELSEYGSVTAYSIANFAAQTGVTLWQFGDHDNFHAGALVGDTLYVTAQHSGPIGNSAGKITNPETVYALDAHTGALRWKFATQSGNSGSLAVSPIGIFIQADDGVHALRPADGAVLWHSPAQNNWLFFTTPTFIGPVIYFFAVQILPPETLTILGGSKGQAYLYAVNATNGNLYWGVPVGPVVTISPHIVF
jgi:outer membrane protein assembly factor BamB